MIEIRFFKYQQIQNGPVVKSGSFIAFSICSLLVTFFFSFTAIGLNFDETYSTVLTDREGGLLAVKLSADEQWKFPPAKSIPQRYEKAMLMYEDRYFYFHFGVNPVAIVKSAIANWHSGKITSGASTITMQLARIGRGNRHRNYCEKIIEIFYAFRLELDFSKKELLNIYAAQAPFGGNVIGLEAASWRYFGRSPDQLSWGEITVLAVLPNSPSLIYPGKNQERLIVKRNRLLDKLCKAGYITDENSVLAQLETLPVGMKNLPDYTPHLLSTVIKDGLEGQRVQTSIDPDIQRELNSLLIRHGRRLNAEGVQNAAAVVIDVDTGEALAYAGNIPSSQIDSCSQIDMIRTKRSTGSILKPILYAWSVEDGIIFPKQLLPDYPVYFQGFTPKNITQNFEGAVPADRALARSLNVPFVFLLQEYDYGKFAVRLDQTGLKLDYPAGHYGLSMILGSVESSLWDVTSTYASMARVLNRYNQLAVDTNIKNYQDSDYHLAAYIKNTNRKIHKNQKNGRLSAASVYLTFEALTQVARPEDDLNWEMFVSSSKIAWKTGTSFGAKDGWAIGVNSKYCIGVWTGNADNTGISGFLASRAAGPLLFDVFRILPDNQWFKEPVSDIALARVCSKSGMLAGPNCEEDHIQKIPGHERTLSQMCPYHKTLNLDIDGKFQVDSTSYPVENIIQQKWFILPPVMEWYYKQKNVSYQSAPTTAPGENFVTQAAMQFIYPDHKTRIYVPIELDGSRGKVVFELAHRKPETEVYWTLDGEFLGKTRYTHQMACSPEPGKHTISVVDEKGNRLEKQFEVNK